MHKLTLFGAAFLLATLAFWGTMLTAPPRIVAGEPAAGFDPTALTSSNLPTAEEADTYRPGGRSM